MKTNQDSIAIYSRKSKFTGKGESVANQIELCREYILRTYGEQYAERILVFEDEGFSGGNLNRPAFKRMMDAAKDGQFSEYQARQLTFEYAKEQDIIVCASDLMAIGAMKALIEMDIFRPVCGFDGITLMGYVGKQMNTIHQNFSNISKEAVNEIARLMDGGEGRNVILPHEIVRLRYEDIIR